MVMIDTISRLVPGVLHNDVSAEFESFQDNLLEYPQYSRPGRVEGRKFRPSFCPDIMRILKNGEESSQSFVQWSGARIFSRK